MNDDRVRVEIYRSFMEEGRAPTTVQLADAVQLPPDQVIQVLRSLAEASIIELMPGTDLIWLAHPFSAIEAPFKVTNTERTWEAICIWDALGVLAITDSDGTVETRCPDCAEELSVEVSDGHLIAPAEALVHFGVPASRWYEDIAHT